MGGVFRIKGRICFFFNLFHSAFGDFDQSGTSSSAWPCCLLGFLGNNLTALDLLRTREGLRLDVQKKIPQQVLLDRLKGCSPIFTRNLLSNNTFAMVGTMLFLVS